jgi:hypothetical protein
VLFGVVFGGLLAVVEGWGWDVGIAFCLSNILGLQDALTNLLPTSAVGQAWCLLMSFWNAFFNSIAAVVMSMSPVVMRLKRQLQRSIAILLASLFVGLPVMLCILSLVTGAIIAQVEDWSVGDGVLYMGAALAALANPLTGATPKTSTAMFVEVVCISVNIAVSGAVIGIVMDSMTSFDIQWWSEHTSEVSPDIVADLENGKVLRDTAITGDKVNDADAQEQDPIEVLDPSALPTNDHPSSLHSSYQRAG